ncbi:MAG: hypothetical protein EPO08_16510 [Rhodospirillaceae bacterium]|nr:MAG: hypothetical protein EPO08_16510 [Rhodospirillaceae bacterium]
MDALVGKRSADVPIPRKFGAPRWLWRSVNYTLKTKFQRRERLRDGKGDSNTSYEKLRADERRELAMVLHDLGITGRLFMRGIKRSHWTFKLIRSVPSKNSRILLKIDLEVVRMRWRASWTEK